MQEPGANSVRMVYCATESVGVASGNGDGRAEKPRYYVLQGVGVKNRYEAELTNQRRGSGSKRCILLYRTEARNGGGIPLSVVCFFL